MTVDEQKAAATSTYKGQTYYFCSPGCKATFEKSPESYLGGSTGGHGAHAGHGGPHHGGHCC